MGGVFIDTQKGNFGEVAKLLIEKMPKGKTKKSYVYDK